MVTKEEGLVLQAVPPGLRGGCISDNDHHNSDAAKAA
jgi:hypothetical protein